MICNILILGEILLDVGVGLGCVLRAWCLMLFCKLLRFSRGLGAPVLAADWLLAQWRVTKALVILVLAPVACKRHFLATLSLILFSRAQNFFATKLISSTVSNTFTCRSSAQLEARFRCRSGFLTHSCGSS